MPLKVTIFLVLALQMIWLGILQPIEKKLAYRYTHWYTNKWRSIAMVIAIILQLWLLYRCRFVLNLI